MTWHDNHLREISRQIWDARHDLSIEMIEGDPDGIKLTNGETMKAPDTKVISLSSGITIRMTDSWNGSPVNEKTKITIGNDTLSFEGITLIHRAWRSVQCSNILEVLGGVTPDVPGTFAHPAPRKLLDRIFRRKPPFETLRHLRIVLAQRIHEVTSESGVIEASGICKIGNDVSIGAEYHPTRWENAYEAWVFHPDIGSTPMPYRDIKSAIDKVSGRALQRLTLTSAMRNPISIPSGSRSSELLRIGHLAIGSDPDLVDENGMRIDALVREHLPELLTRHRRALTNAVDDEQRKCVDAEFDQGLDIVAKALDEAMTLRGTESHEDLLTQVRFLRMRHPAPTFMIKR